MSVIREQFADWFRPANFGMNAESMEIRREVVESIASDLSNKTLTELVRAVFARPIASPDVLVRFRQRFNDADPTFRMSGNDEEVVALAGCVLAAVLTIGSAEAIGNVASTILAASVAKSRLASVRFDVVGMAENALSVTSRQWRERPVIGASGDNLVFKDSSARADNEEEKPERPPIERAVEDIALLAQAHNALVSQHQDLVRFLDLQDEELEVLWWLVTGWSDIGDRPFDQLPTEARPIVLAAELATKNKHSVEMPSLRAIFSRAGIETVGEVGIPDAVNACGEYLAVLAQGRQTCPTLTPVCLGLERAMETGGGSDWIAAWSAVTGLKADARIGCADLAVQLHRELGISTQVL